jgi:hypothetical protein
MQTDYDIESEHDPHEEELPQVEVLVSPDGAQPAWQTSGRRPTVG